MQSRPRLDNPAHRRDGRRATACPVTVRTACPAKDVRVARAGRADDLNDLAATLAVAAGKPLELGEYDYDA